MYGCPETNITPPFLYREIVLPIPFLLSLLILNNEGVLNHENGIRVVLHGCNYLT